MDEKAEQKIREQARALGFDDWATGDLADLEADVRASRVLKLSKEIRDAAERGNYAAVLTAARDLVAFLEDREAHRC